MNKAIKKHEIKAIFFDIDGTLLSFKTHSVLPSTVEAFSRLRKEGIKLFVATGRTLNEINNLDDLTFDGYITMNGAYCVDAAHKLIHKEVIPPEDIEALFRYLKEKEPFPCVLATQEEDVMNHVNESVLELTRMVDLPVPKIKDFGEMANDQILQMVIFVDKQKEIELMQNVLVNCHVNRWHPSFADVNRSGVSKQLGIDRMLEYHKIDLSETMAFGDGGNDIQMLQHVAVGIAMGNANDEVKRVAGYVTDSIDNDGIWNALQRFLWH